MKFAKPLTISELKQMFIENMLNKTDKVSKISDESVLNAIAYGVAKVGQKCMKDVALMESLLLVDSAYGSTLDTLARNLGISDRFGALAGSTYVRLVGDSGTTYTPGVHVCSGSNGLQWDFDEQVVIGSSGFAYGKIRCTSTGEATNVDPFTINSISPTPTGHDYLVNEYMAQGGRDSEDDDMFRKRIREGANLAATGTIAKLEQVFMKINPLVLRCFNLGTNSSGKTVIGVATQTGASLTEAEITQLLNQSAEYLSLTELQLWSYDSIGFTIENIDYEYIDVDFRCELETDYDSQDVAKDVQIRYTKYLDFRFWDYSKKVEWDDLLQITKNTEGIKYVSDTYFYPQADITVPYTKLPIPRSFVMRDLDGNILVNKAGTVNPVYYPNEPDASFQQTILATID